LLSALPPRLLQQYVAAAAAGELQLDTAASFEFLLYRLDPRVAVNLACWLRVCNTPAAAALAAMQTTRPPLSLRTLPLFGAALDASAAAAFTESAST
jgi:hypothetical protein